MGSTQLTNLRRLILAHAASFSCSHQYNNSNCVCLVARLVSCKVLCLLYQAYIMPILDYCDVVWSPCSAFYTRHLERVHSRFVSSIPSSTSVVLDLKLSLTERRTYHTAVKVFKILHKIAPPYLCDMFQYASAVSGHVGRNP